MRSQISSLPALVCFRAAARTESFSAAAEALNLTHGAVSRAVRLIEEDLGVQLFERRNRRVFLTETGRELAAAVAAGLSQIEEVVRKIKARRGEHRMTLSCEPTLLMRWLIPRLPSFQALVPNVNLQLVAGGGPVSLGFDVDFAIRRNDFPLPSDYNCDQLFQEWIGPVCSPGYEREFLRRVQDRGPVHLLHTRTRREAWENWNRLSEQPPITGSDVEFEHFYFSLQAAVAGLGIAIGPWHLVQDDIENGLLVAPFGFVADGSSYNLLSVSPITEGSIAAALRDWLRQNAGLPLHAVGQAGQK